MFVRFRSKRSAHQALDALDKAATRMTGGWVVELDIRKYFDSIDHEHLRGVLRQWVRDGVVLRLIGKWLNAGVMEDGALQRGQRPRAALPTSGTVHGHVYGAILDSATRPRLGLSGFAGSKLAPFRASRDFLDFGADASGF